MKQETLPLLVLSAARLEGRLPFLLLRNRKRPPVLAAVSYLICLVGARGFEPPTSRSQTERTTRLCYAPTKPAQAGRLHSRGAPRSGQVGFDTERSKSLFSRNSRI